MNGNRHDNLRVLVLGGSGMVGSAFDAVCSRRGIPCFCPAHRVADITSPAQVTGAFDAYCPTVVVNCVAIPSIEPCERDPGAAVALHCTAVERLARECERRDMILVQPSTHAVFDGLKDAPYTEDDPVKATGVYGATKILSERLAAAYCTRHYIPRFPTLFGPRRNGSQGFADKALAWLREGRPLRIAADRMDSPTYSLDAAAAVMEMIAERAPWGVYHVANEGWISYYGFVMKLTLFVASDSEIVPCQEREFGSAYYKPLRTGLRSSKRRPLRSLEDALQEYVGTYVMNAASKQGDL